MKLIEAKPESQVLKKYIDRYQLFDIPDTYFLKTIPNAKIELYTVLEGGLEIWNSRLEIFEEMPKKGFIPATNKSSLLRIKSHLVCLNIKLDLTVLALPWFRKLYSGNVNPATEGYIWDDVSSVVNPQYFLKNNGLIVSDLDTSLSRTFRDNDEDKMVLQIIECIEKMPQFSVSELAEELYVSSRTLNRLTKKYFNLAPKDLANILRFEKTTSYLKENESESLIEALSFGYYDQSHFIKECRKITGTSPKKLFGKMKLSTNDLLVGSTPGSI